MALLCSAWSALSARNKKQDTPRYLRAMCLEQSKQRREKREHRNHSEMFFESLAYSRITILIVSLPKGSYFF